MTTLLDYYGLGSGWRNYSRRPNQNLCQLAGKVESAAWDDIVQKLGGHPAVGSRLWPYLQMHEYEALLFSDVNAFAAGIYQPQLGAGLQAVRNQFRTPEHINNGANTAPSKRIQRLYPGYSKVLEGELGAAMVGLNRMRQECSRFEQWIHWLENLSPIV